MSNSTYCEDHYEQPDWMKKIQGLEKQNKELKELLEKKEKESIDKEKIRKEVKRLRKRAEHNFDISLTENERQFWLGEFNVLTLIGKYIESLQEEPVSEDLEEAAKVYEQTRNDLDVVSDNQIVERAFKAGAEWQKEHLWKPADGDELPEIDREVVAFQEIFPTDVDVQSILKIVIAHRPNPEGYDGKSFTTGEVEHYTPKTYDKGGWNIPDVKYWLDVDLPEQED